MLHSNWNGIVLQEVPDEISLAISISGCSLKCRGCHSSDTWDPLFGTELTPAILNNLITYNKHITCVVFYGGEWNPESLLPLLQTVKSHNLKLCLYTGYSLRDVPKEIIAYLDFIKVGRYVEKLGGIGSPGTNQQFIKLTEN